MPVLNNYAKRLVQASKLIVNKKSPTMTSQMSFCNSRSFYPVGATGMRDWQQQQPNMVNVRQMATDTKPGEGAKTTEEKKATTEGIRKAPTEGAKKQEGENLKQQQGQSERQIKHEDPTHGHKGLYDVDPKHQWDKMREYGGDIQADDHPWKLDWKAICIFAVTGVAVYAAAVGVFRGFGNVWQSICPKAKNKAKEAKEATEEAGNKLRTKATGDSDNK